MVEEFREKSCVLHVGVDLLDRFGTCIDVVEERVDNDDETTAAQTAKPPLVLWNMRWEYDKNPRAFFSTLVALAREGVDFELAVCGERTAFTDDSFEQLLAPLLPRLVHQGFADDNVYRQLLWRADVTFSTALHEFFGVAVVEACACECFVLLPRRLAYPEVIPERFHNDVFYFNETHLAHRLRWALSPHNTHARRQIASSLAAAVRARFDWSVMIKKYEEILFPLKNS